MSPFVVNGTHFKRGETVGSVVVLKAHEHVRIGQGVQEGRVHGPFPRLVGSGIRADRYSVRAKGNKGSRAFSAARPRSALGG